MPTQSFGPPLLCSVMVDKTSSTGACMKLLLLLVAFFCFVGVSLGAGIDYTPCCSDSSRIVRPFRKAYKGPIIDTHAHLSGGNPSGIYIQEMAGAVNKSTVDGLILMPAPNSGKKDSKGDRVKIIHHLTAKTSGRVKAFCGSNYTNYWMFEASKHGFSESKFNKLRQRLSIDLKSKDCLGYGEIAIRHYDKYGETANRKAQPVLVVPYNFAPLHAFLSIANDLGNPIDLHIEPMTRRGESYESAWIQEIEDLSRRYQNLILILSHTGMTRSDNLRKIMVRYPNVFTNIKLITQSMGWKNLEPPNNPESKAFYEDWAQLFEDMPKRFMVGSDYKFFKKRTKSGRKSVKGYEKTINDYRKVLGSLSKAAAEAVAYKNAKNIFGF